MLGGVLPEVSEALNILNVAAKALPFPLLLELMPSQAHAEPALRGPSDSEL